MSKAVLLIHGFATDIDDFYNIIPDLTKRYDYIELKNLPGHGKNSNLKQFDVEKTFACVEESAQKLLARFDEVDVIGFSMGGSLAAYLASKYHFNKIVLLAPANNYINWKLPSVRLKLLIDYYYKRFIYKDYDSEYEKELNKLKEDDKRSISMLFKRLIPNYTIKAIKTFMKIISICNENIKDISEPSLIVWGDIDQLVPYSSIEFLKQYCENVHVQVIEKLSHLMLYSKEYPIISKYIFDFLDN